MLWLFTEQLQWFESRIKGVSQWTRRPQAWWAHYGPQYNRYRSCRVTQTSRAAQFTCLVCLVYLVYLVCLVYLVSLVSGLVLLVNLGEDSLWTDHHLIYAQAFQAGPFLGVSRCPCSQILGGIRWLFSHSALCLPSRSFVHRGCWLWHRRQLPIGRVLQRDVYKRQVEDLEKVREIKVVTRMDWPALNTEQAHHLYCIIRECLNNTQKYAQANEVSIDAKCDGAMLTVVVQDNGTGFDAAEQISGYGLKGIAERVQHLNGTCKIESTPSVGTSVSIQIPLLSS